MNDVLRLAWEYSLLLVGGATVLLGIGCLVVATCRAPVHRQRLSELTVGGVLGWLILTLLPLPRLVPPVGHPRSDWPASAENRVSSSLLRESPIQEWEDVSKVRPEAVLTSSVPTSFESDESLVLEHSEGFSPPPKDVDQSTPVFTMATEEVHALSRTSSAVNSWIDTSSIVGFGLLGIYLVCVVAGATLLLVGQGLLLWIRAAGARPPTWLDRQYQQLAGKAHVTAVELLVSRHCSRPITWGLFRPTIVLPQRLCDETKRQQVGTILLHELGHVARRDAFGNLLFCMVSPLLYCHPFYWWLRREWNLAAELIADDWAARQTGKDVYIEELMDLARTSKRNGFPFVGVTAVFSSPSQFYRRMHMLLTREQPLSTQTSVRWQLTTIAVTIVGIALASSLGGVRPAVAQNSGSPTAEAKLSPETPMATAPAAPQPAEPPRPSDSSGDHPTPTEPAPSEPLHRQATPTNSAKSRDALIQALRAEQAVLEAKLRSLQDRITELGGVPPAATDPTKPRLPVGPAKLPVGPGGVITLTRVDGDGVVWTETWSVDEREQPGKLIKREAAGKLPVNVRTEVTPDGKVLKVFAGENGSVTIHVYDSATGKLIETRHENSANLAKPGDKHDSSSPPDQPRLATPPPTATPKSTPSIGVGPQLAQQALSGSPDRLPPGTFTRPVENEPSLPPAHPSERGQGVSSGYRELDLLTLATSYADAVANLEASQAKLAGAEAIAKENASGTNKHDIALARLEVAAAQRKQQLLQRIAKVALASVSKELDRVTQLHQAGVVPASELEAAQTRMEILRQILTTQLGN